MVTKDSDGEKTTVGITEKTEQVVEPAVAAPVEKEPKKRRVRKTRKRRQAKEKEEVSGKKEVSATKRKEPTFLGIPQTPFILALIVIAFGVGIIMSGRLNEKTKGETVTPAVETTTVAQTSSGRVKLDFYVMSMCPYGVQVENAIKPVLDKLGNSVEFTLNFIAADQGNGKFQSLHGQGEVDENLRQVCAMKYYPAKYMDYVVCRNKNIQSTEWQTCAQQAGLDTNKIKACSEGDEGNKLLSVSIQKSDAVNAQGSPTIYLNGKQYSSGRDSISFQRALCQQISTHPECVNLPACAQDTDCQAQPGKEGKCVNPNSKDAKCVYSDPVKFEAIVLNDKNCGTACDATRITQVLKQLFLGISIRSVDISTDEGKKLVGELAITVAPAYLFDSKIASTAAWTNDPRLRAVFEKKGSYYKLSDDATGASWFVNEEAKKKYQDAIALTPGDNKPQIDFFVMSYCPYGNQAEELISSVYDTLGDKAEFKPHYVVYENYGGGGPDYCLDNGKYCSMHGIQELNQDIRELCVLNQSGIGKYFAFVKEMNKKCTSQNADSCWTDVAKGLGLDTEAIGKCEKDRGIELMKKERELNVILKVSGSPTIFVEGEQYVGTRTVAGIGNALCSKYTTKPKECDSMPKEQPAAASSAAPSGGGCG